jgi:glutaminase
METFSSALDLKSNSVRGIQVFKELAARFGLHAFEVCDGRATILSQF